MSYSRPCPPRSPDTGTFTFSDIRLGSRGDSYYEYLGKQYLQTNRTEPVYKRMHDEAMGGIKSHLLHRSVTKNLVYTSELLPTRDQKTQSLSVEHYYYSPHEHRELISFHPDSESCRIRRSRTTSSASSARASSSA